MDLLLSFTDNAKLLGLATTGKPILVAVSGGVDSMVLAQLFHSSGFTMGIAHCNFQLRGADANGDEQLVEQWCAERQIPFFCTRFDTEARAQEWKKGTQETARILRYSWFDELRVQHGYSFIATAHHLNDNVETLLLNLFKGTGIAGLHGIRPINGHLIRPLLFADKATIEAYAHSNNLVWRHDASNDTDNYTRNVLRRQVLPVIEQWFPNAQTQIADSIGRFAEAEQVYQKGIAQERKALLDQRGNDMYIPIRKLKKREPLATICYELLQPYGFAAAQVQQCLHLMDAESGHYMASATHRLIKNRDFLIITTLPAQTADLVVIDTFPCSVIAGGYCYQFALMPPPQQLETDKNTVYLDYSKVEAPLLLRKWKTGDYLYPIGMEMKKKKVSRMLINDKVPLHEKEEIRVLETNKRLAWLAGMRMDERFKVKPATTEVLRVSRKLI